MNYFKKILRLNRKNSSTINPQSSPLYIEINKLLKEHEIKNEISGKFFAASSVTEERSSDLVASTAAAVCKRSQLELVNENEDALKVGSLLCEILVSELSRRPNHRNSTGNERVHSFLRALVDHAFLDVNLIRNFLNQSILYTATENNDVALCRLLVESGADFLGEDNYRQTPFILAAKKNYFGVLRVFVDELKKDHYGDLQHVNKQIRLATYHACYSGNFDIVRFMFERFALTTEQLIMQTPRDDLELEWTSSLGKKSKLRLSELNPLHVCCYKANFEIVRFLLSHLDDKSITQSVVNSPINEYRDSTALEEAFKGLLMFDLNNEIDLKFSIGCKNGVENNNNNISVEYSNRQTKKKNYKKIINLLVENGARFSISFINNNGMCKLLTQVFTGPNKDADFVHFLSCTNYLFKFKLDELFVYSNRIGNNSSTLSSGSSSISSPSTSISSLSASQESLLLMITQKGMLLSDANDLALSRANDLSNMIDEFLFKVYLLCLRVIKDYKGVCLNYFIDTLVNLHYSQQAKLSTSKLSYLKDKNPEIYEHLADLTRAPLTLKSLCSSVIRRSIRFYGIDKVNNLAIPNTLKYEIFFNSSSKGYCISFDYYSYFLYKQLNRPRPV